MAAALHHPTAGGPNITIPANATGELDQATIAGPNASRASGTVTFRLYSGSACTAATLVPGSSSTSTVQDTSLSAFAGSAPVSTPLSPGTYYWKVAYSGDSDDQASTSSCGAETLTVAPVHIIGPLVSNGSVIALVMSCQVACRLRITITAPASRLATDARENGQAKPRVITLARASVTIRKHGVQRARLRLTSAGRRFVATHSGRVTVTAAIAMTIDGHTRVLTRRLTLTIAKPGKHRVLDPFR